MNAEKVKKDIERAVEMAQSIHDDMVEKFTADSVPSEIMIPALELTSRLVTLVWYLEHVSEGGVGMTSEELKATLISAIMELTETEAAELLQQRKEAAA